jgi:outer membrane biosynthesis protein TonB
MTPADRRITELIDKWLASIDLHLKYVELSDAAYARVQAWPKHDRPTRWVLEVARQKILELKAQCETRQAMGDGKFSEALELMAFLANLVGIQHIQRFVPLADPSRTEPVVSSTTATVELVQPPRTAPAQKPRNPGDDTTREMPRIKATAPPPRPAPTPARAAPAPARTAPAPAPTPSPAKRTDGARAPVRPAAAAPPRPAAAAAAKSTSVSADLRGKIIADAIRLLKWGKSWHELPELIERIAERPSATEIRKVLRANRADIEAKASGEG